MADFVLAAMRCPQSESASPVRPEAVEQSVAPDCLQPSLRCGFQQQVSLRVSQRGVAISRITTDEILKRLDVPAKVALGKDLPWPYNGMVADITSAIETGCNYLAALGLSCYTEYCGRELLFTGDATKKDWECFNEFIP